MKRTCEKCSKTFIGSGAMCLVCFTETDEWKGFSGDKPTDRSPEMPNAEEVKRYTFKSFGYDYDVYRDGKEMNAEDIANTLNTLNTALDASRAENEKLRELLDDVAGALVQGVSIKPDCMLHRRINDLLTPPASDERKG